MLMPTENPEWTEKPRLLPYCEQCNHVADIMLRNPGSQIVMRGSSIEAIRSDRGELIAAVSGGVVVGDVLDCLRNWATRDKPESPCYKPPEPDIPTTAELFKKLPWP